MILSMLGGCAIPACLAAGGLLPGGVPGPGVPGPGGVCSGGVPGGDPPGRPLLRAVRILLECILVLSNVDHVAINLK